MRNEVAMLIVKHGMDAVTNIVRIEIYDVAYLTIHQTQISEQLFFEQFTIFYYRLQLQNQFVVNDEVQSHIGRNEYAFIIDWHSHLISDTKTIVS